MAIIKGFKRAGVSDVTPYEMPIDEIADGVIKLENRSTTNKNLINQTANSLIKDVRDHEDDQNKAIEIQNDYLSDVEKIIDSSEGDYSNIDLSDLQNLATNYLGSKDFRQLLDNKRNQDEFVKQKNEIESRGGEAIIFGPLDPTRDSFYDSEGNSNRFTGSYKVEKKLDAPKRAKEMFLNIGHELQGLTKWEEGKSGDWTTYWQKWYKTNKNNNEAVDAVINNATQSLIDTEQGSQQYRIYVRDLLSDGLDKKDAEKEAFDRMTDLLTWTGESVRYNEDDEKSTRQQYKDLNPDAINKKKSKNSKKGSGTEKPKVVRSATREDITISEDGLNISTATTTAQNLIDVNQSYDASDYDRGAISNANWQSIENHYALADKYTNVMRPSDDGSTDKLIFPGVFQELDFSINIDYKENRAVLNLKTYKDIPTDREEMSKQKYDVTSPELWSKLKKDDINIPAETIADNAGDNLFTLDDFKKAYKFKKFPTNSNDLSLINSTSLDIQNPGLSTLHVNHDNEGNGLIEIHPSLYSLRDYYQNQLKLEEGSTTPNDGRIKLYQAKLEQANRKIDATKNFMEVHKDALESQQGQFKKIYLNHQVVEDHLKYHFNRHGFNYEDFKKVQSNELEGLTKEEVDEYNKISKSISEYYSFKKKSLVQSSWPLEVAGEWIMKKYGQEKYDDFLKKASLLQVKLLNEGINLSELTRLESNKNVSNKKEINERLLHNYLKDYFELDIPYSYELTGIRTSEHLTFKSHFGPLVNDILEDSDGNISKHNLDRKKEYLSNYENLMNEKYKSNPAIKNLMDELDDYTKTVTRKDYVLAIPKDEAKNNYISNRIKDKLKIAFADQNLEIRNSIFGGEEGNESKYITEKYDRDLFWDEVTSSWVLSQSQTEQEKYSGASSAIIRKDPKFQKEFISNITENNLIGIRHDLTNIANFGQDKEIKGNSAFVAHFDFGSGKLLEIDLNMTQSDMIGIMGDSALRLKVLEQAKKGLKESNGLYFNLNGLANNSGTKVFRQLSNSLGGVKDQAYTFGSDVPEKINRGSFYILSKGLDDVNAGDPNYRIGQEGMYKMQFKTETDLIQWYRNKNKGNFEQIEQTAKYIQYLKQGYTAEDLGLSEDLQNLDKNSLIELLNNRINTLYNGNLDNNKTGGAHIGNNISQYVDEGVVKKTKSGYNIPQDKFNSLNNKKKAAIAKSANTSLSKGSWYDHNNDGEVYRVPMKTEDGTPVLEDINEVLNNNSSFKSVVNSKYNKLQKPIANFISTIDKINNINSNTTGTTSNWKGPLEMIDLLSGGTWSQADYDAMLKDFSILQPNDTITITSALRSLQTNLGAYNTPGGDLTNIIDSNHMRGLSIDIRTEPIRNNKNEIIEDPTRNYKGGQNLWKFLQTPTGKQLLTKLNLSAYWHTVNNSQSGMHIDLSIKTPSRPTIYQKLPGMKKSQSL